MKIRVNKIVACSWQPNKHSLFLLLNGIVIIQQFPVYNS